MRLPISESEEEQRRQEHKAQCEAIRASADQEIDRRIAQDVAAAVRDLPPFVPGSMTSGETYFMRVCRALNDSHWDMTVAFAENLLAIEYQRANGESVSTSQPKPRPHLTLIVNNAANDTRH